MTKSIGTKFRNKYVQPFLQFKIVGMVKHLPLLSLIFSFLALNFCLLKHVQITHHVLKSKPPQIKVPPFEGTDLNHLFFKLLRYHLIVVVAIYFIRCFIPNCRMQSSPIILIHIPTNTFFSLPLRCIIIEVHMFIF